MVTRWSASRIFNSVMITGHKEKTFLLRIPRVCMRLHHAVTGEGSLVRTVTFFVACVDLMVGMSTCGKFSVWSVMQLVWLRLQLVCAGL